MRPAVRAVRLSKFYGSHWNPRSLLHQILRGRDSSQQIRALEGVSFQVVAGHALGVVGQNGSGKTTLLKIVAGATHPSSGRVEVDGRIGSLLDLGAGFHPEFSGRENIRFSGALMGLEPDRVREAEDRIVAFSELEEFIDQPVRTYSAGMYVRLGFAVTTGFHPSVLVIDEALAVGDQPFQKKCTDRILAIMERGPPSLSAPTTSTRSKPCARRRSGSGRAGPNPRGMPSRWWKTTVDIWGKRRLPATGVPTPQVPIPP